MFKDRVDIPRGLRGAQVDADDFGIRMVVTCKMAQSDVLHPISYCCLEVDFTILDSPYTSASAYI